MFFEKLFNKLGKTPMTMNSNMKARIKGSSSITINGHHYTGQNLSIKNGVVTIDGVVQDTFTEQVIMVTINGDVDYIENSNGTVNAQNVGNITTGNGDVSCGNVSGSVRTSLGNVDCDGVSGSVQTTLGNVDCDIVYGDVTTQLGDIKHKKK